MKIRRFFSRIFLSLFLLCACCFSAVLLAKDIHLYDQPKPEAKVIGTVNLTVGIIPIFTSKDSAWMKVADPRNGNVGWIKSADISARPGETTTYTVRQQILHDGKGPHTYQFIQYGPPQTLSNEEVQNRIKAMQMQQQSMQKAVQEMMNGMDHLFDNQFPFPLIMTIVIMPQQKSITPAPEKSTTQPSSAAALSQPSSAPSINKANSKTAPAAQH